MDRQPLLGEILEAFMPGLAATILCPMRVPCLTCCPASALNTSLVAQTWGSPL